MAESTGLAIETQEQFNEAVDKGALVFDQATGSWQRGAIALDTVARTYDQLDAELAESANHLAHVSKEVLFKSRDRMGTRRAKPLWTEIMELMGGEFKDVRDQFYDEA